MNPKKILKEFKEEFGNDKLQLFIGEDDNFYVYYRTNGRTYTYKVVDKMNDENRSSLYLGDDVGGGYEGISNYYIEQKRLLKLEKLT